MIITNHLQAERSVLSTLLEYNDQYDAVSRIISVTDFESTAHQAIYELITELASKGEPHDFLMVAELIERRHSDDISGYVQKRLAEIGGVPAALPKYLIFHAELMRDKSLRRQSAKILQQAIAELEGDTDFVQVTDSLQSDLIALTDNEEDVKEVYTMDDMLQGLADRMGKINAGEKPYIDLGFPELNAMVRAKAGNLVVIAGRPSMGKSLLVVNIQDYLAKYTEGEDVFFSAEMEEEDITNRLAAAEANIAIDSITNNEMTVDEKARFFRFFSDRKGGRLIIVRKPEITISQIRAHLNRIKREKSGKISSIGVDYLQIMGGLDGQDSVKKIGVVTRTLKALGSEFNCPVFLLSQLNRSVESRPNKRPVNSDLRDSGTIEQDADIIAMVYRDDYYNQQAGDKTKQPDGIAEIIITKNRNGSTGTVRLLFEGQYGRFANLMPHYQADEIPAYGSEQA